MSVLYIAKEFKFHSVCYRKKKEKSTTNVPSTSDNTLVALGISSNFDLNKEYITDKILDQKEAVSMRDLHKIYGTKSRRYSILNIAFLTAKHNVPELFGILQC